MSQNENPVEKLANDWSDAERLGIDIQQLHDLRAGHIIPNSDGHRCELVRWTGNDDPPSDATGRAHIGKRGVTVYATKEPDSDTLVLVRFDDGAELWCYLNELRFD